MKEPLWAQLGIGDPATRIEHNGGGGGRDSPVGRHARRRAERGTGLGPSASGGHGRCPVRGASLADQGDERAAAARAHPPARGLLAGRAGARLRPVQAHRVARPGQRRAGGPGPGGRAPDRRAGPVGPAVRDPARRGPGARPGHRARVRPRRDRRPGRGGQGQGVVAGPRHQRPRAGRRTGRARRPALRGRRRAEVGDHPDGNRQPRRVRPAEERHEAHRGAARLGPPGGAGGAAGGVRPLAGDGERRGRGRAGRTSAGARPRRRPLRVRTHRYRHRHGAHPRRPAPARGARRRRGDRVPPDVRWHGRRRARGPQARDARGGRVGLRGRPGRASRGHAGSGVGAARLRRRRGR